MKFVFSFGCLPPSTNNLFFTVPKTFRRVKSAEYVAFEKLVAQVCAIRTDRREIVRMVGRPYRMTVDLFSPSWRYKNGNMKRQDLDNLLKALSDSICKQFGLADECCVELIARKLVGQAEKTVVSFEFIEKSLPL